MTRAGLLAGTHMHSQAAFHLPENKRKPTIDLNKLDQISLALPLSIPIFPHPSTTLPPSHGFQGSQDRQQHNSSEQPRAQNGTETWIFSCLLLGPALQKLLRENQCQGRTVAAGGCSTPPWSASPISSPSQEGKRVSTGRARCCMRSHGMV